MTGHKDVELARRQILALSESALSRAGVIGVLPTPLDQVAAVADIAEIVDIGNLPPALEAQKPSGLHKILGALLYKERTVFVDLSQNDGRARLTEAHEIGHKLIPWHEAAFRLDDLETITGRTHDHLEEEAFLAGGHLIFQGARFHDKALDYEVSIKTPLLLADEYGASYHATIRYYVMHHPDALALLVAGRYAASGSVPLWKSVESPLFLERYGRLVTRRDQRIPVGAESPHPLGTIAFLALAQSEIADTRFRLADRNGRQREFVAESFFNQHNLLIMVSEARATRFGRALKAAVGHR